MSGRLDQSLDSIIDSQKKAKKEQGRRRKAAVKVKTPVGGVKKATKPVRPAIKPSVVGPRPSSSKIVVSQLPHDVDEKQIKDYFIQAVGNVKKVSLQYNQSGQSRGIADIIFGRPDLAAKAAKDCNGLLVDGRPMKIEVIVGAAALPAVKEKSFSDRVTSANPKAQPKSAVDRKVKVKPNVKGPKAAANAKPKKTQNAKPRAKTAEELDAEMTDYFNNNNAGTAAANAAAATNGAAEPAAAGGDDLGMEEIS